MFRDYLDEERLYRILRYENLNYTLNNVNIPKGVFQFQFNLPLNLEKPILTTKTYWLLSGFTFYDFSNVQIQSLSNQDKSYYIVNLNIPNGFNFILRPNVIYELNFNKLYLQKQVLTFQLYDDIGTSGTANIAVNLRLEIKIKNIEDTL